MRAIRIRSSLSSSRVALISLSLFLLFPVSSTSQSAPSTPPPTGNASGELATPGSSVTVPIKTNVDEISLDLAVRTKRNKTVRDLQPSELKVTDDGSLVQLSSLRLVASDSGSQHLVTLVFDRLNPAAAKVARAMAEKILAVFPSGGYSFAVLEVNGRLRLLQSYTRARWQVDTALDQATAASPALPPADLTPAEKTLIASAHSDALVDRASRAQGKLILSALEQSQRILEDRRANPSLAALQALVLSDRLLTGRKFIFYFSEGIDPNSDSRNLLKSIVGMANRAGVTICAVEANPMDGKMSSAMQASAASSFLGKGVTSANISSFGATGGGFSPGGAMNSVAVHYSAGFEFGDADSSESPLAPLASGTGGIYFRATGNSKHQLQQLHDDLTDWYEASWAPSIKDYDGQFRPIDIHSLRKDLVIRARSGYFAVSPTESSGTSPFEVPLMNILGGSALPAELAFHAGILHLGTLPDGNSAELAVQVPVSQLQIHEDSSTHISSVDAAIVAVIKDSKGVVLERFGEDFPRHETPEMFRQDSGQVITLERHFSADPGAYTLETAVMDRVSNKVGAQRTTFTIEPATQGPALSDVALVERVEPTEQDAQAFEPMLYRDGRIVPNVDPDLPGGTNSLSLFFLIHPVAGSQSQPTLRMQILRNGKLITEMPMELQKVSGTGAAIPYLGSIHGHGFLPGDYQFNALLTQDGSTVSSSASFHVEGDAGANSTESLSADSAPAPDTTDSRLVEAASTANSQFVITSPTEAVAPPSDAEIQGMIEGARQRALAWSNSLQNFSCVEITSHSVDATGHGDWKHKDTLVELMRYVDHGESRATLMLNGERSSAKPDQLQFAHSAGEFGAMFKILFNPSAKTDFTWQRSAFIDGQPVEVFAFKVARANSGFDLADRSLTVLRAGFHGLLFLDPATLSVRRISIDADDIPSALLIRASSISIDYAWIAMQDHDFLLPVRGAVSLQETRRRPVLNEFEFRDFRRFGSDSRVLSDEELKTLSKK